MNRKEFMKIIGLSSAYVVMPNMMFGNSRGKMNNEKVCKAAWDKLCGDKIGKTYKTDVFDYVHPKKGLPNVLIYGDSISIGYGASVRHELKEKATVVRLFKNGGSSHNFIPNMEVLEKTMFEPSLEGGWDFEWDVIHFNVGLHDLKYLKGKHLNKKGKQVSSIDDYKTNLNEICKYLKTNFPNSKLIFATTTPVSSGSKGRFEGDSIKFNKAAMEVIVKYPEIAVNNMFAFTFPNLKEWAQEPGNVHYNGIGKNKQGKEVARIIEDNLE